MPLVTSGLQQAPSPSAIIIDLFTHTCLSASEFLTWVDLWAGRKLDPGLSRRGKAEGSGRRSLSSGGSWMSGSYVDSDDVHQSLSAQTLPFPREGLWPTLISKVDWKYQTTAAPIWQSGLQRGGVHVDTHVTH